MEVWLLNPLAVPLQLDSVALHAVFVPNAPQENRGALPALDASSGRSSGGGPAGGNSSSTTATTSTATTSATTTTTSAMAAADRTCLDADAEPSATPTAPPGVTAATYWQPRAVGPVVVLPQGSQPLRLLLQGRATAEGRLHLLGLRASMWGVTWLQVRVRTGRARKCTWRSASPCGGALSLGFEQAGGAVHCGRLSPAKAFAKARS